jgi:hypothetical protein
MTPGDRKIRARVIRSSSNVEREDGAVRMMMRCARAAALAGLCSTAAACGLLGETTTHESVRGRLKFVYTSTATGSYGNEKTYSFSSGHFRFSGSRVWALGSFPSCSPSPNEAREAFACSRQEDMRELVDVVAVVGDRPRAVNIHDGDLRDSTHSPAWVGDREGRWLVFKDFLYDVETGEKRPITGAPGPYDAAFRAASPDVETVAYQLPCLAGLAESETAKKIEALCADADARQLEVLWLVEVRTGAVEVRRLRRSDHEWLTDGGRVSGGDVWLASFRRHLVWERDDQGRFRLVAPRADTP